MKAMKVVIYVPRPSADLLRQVIGEAGGGEIGAYSYCSFSSVGTGRFRPEQGSKPAIGTVGRTESVEEERIEFVCAHEMLQKVVSAIRKVHPYEEPVIDAHDVEML